MALNLLRADPRLIDLRELCICSLEELAVLQSPKHAQWNHNVASHRQGNVRFGDSCVLKGLATRIKKKNVEHIRSFFTGISCMILLRAPHFCRGPGCSWTQPAVTQPGHAGSAHLFGARDHGFAPWTTGGDQKYGKSYKNVGRVLGLGPWWDPGRMYSLSSSQPTSWGTLMKGMQWNWKGEVHSKDGKGEFLEAIRCLQPQTILWGPCPRSVDLIWPNRHSWRQEDF